MIDMIYPGVSGGGTYIDGWVAPVPNSKRQEFLETAAISAEVFRTHGARRVVQAWGNDIPKGRITDFYRAVKAEDDENVVFHFVEWPDKATRDRGWAKVEADPRLQPGQIELPFDGKRMFQGGFEIILDTALPGSASKSSAPSDDLPPLGSHS